MLLVGFTTPVALSCPCAMSSQPQHMNESLLLLLCREWGCPHPRQDCLVRQGFHHLLHPVCGFARPILLNPAVLAPPISSAECSSGCCRMLMLPRRFCCRSDFWTRASIRSCLLQPTACQVQAHPNLCCTSQRHGLPAVISSFKAFTHYSSGASAQRPRWSGILRYCLCRPFSS